MPDRIIMPKTGMTMVAGIIVEWKKKEGDEIQKGEVIAEIETDKATMELESDYSGTILKIMHPAGSVVPVVNTIAWIGSPGEKIPEQETKPDIYDSHIHTIEVAKPLAVNENPLPVLKPFVFDPRVKATPAARRLAAERGIKLKDVRTRGRNGEVRAADILSVDTEAVAPEDRIVELTRIQRTAGIRLTRSHNEIPAVTQHFKADITELINRRKVNNKNGGIKISVNDFILYASAVMLKKHPRLNSRLITDNKILYKGRINIGVAVATAEGLVVPVLRDAGSKNITEIAAEAKALAGKGRNGQLRPEDMSDGTFTVSNLGMYDVVSFTPIINQPEAAILGVCAAEDELKMINGKIENRKIIGLSLTYDHRIIDGADAALAVRTLKSVLESPETIL